MALGKQREPSPDRMEEAIRRIPNSIVILGAVAAVLILISSLVFCGGKNPVRTTPVVDNYGHALFIEEYDGTKGIIHDPECEKYRKVIDDFMLKAIVHAFDTLEVKVVE